MIEITPIYGGRASVRFDARTHRYLVTVPGIWKDELQPSVTSALKMKDKSDALVSWATKSMEARIKEYLNKVEEPYDRDMVFAAVESSRERYRQLKEDAAEIGTVVHAWLEQEIKARAGWNQHPSKPLVYNSVLMPNLTQDMIDQANNAIDAGVEYFDTHKIKLIQSEAPRWSPTHGYIGTGDLIAEVNGIPSVLDFKTSKAIYPTIWLQLAAYQVAYTEEFGVKLEQRVGINVRKDGTLEDDKRNNMTLQDDFQCFLALLDVYRWHQENEGYWNYRERRKILQPAPKVFGAFA